MTCLGAQELQCELNAGRSSSRIPVQARKQGEAETLLLFYLWLRGGSAVGLWRRWRGLQLHSALLRHAIAAAGQHPRRLLRLLVCGGALEGDISISVNKNTCRQTQCRASKAGRHRALELGHTLLETTRTYVAHGLRSKTRGSGSAPRAAAAAK